MRILAIILMLLAFPLPAATRSQAQKKVFAQAHPCPATGRPVPSCAGYVIDHIIPLCAGGQDVASNMQWQQKAISYQKDAIERAYCACEKQFGSQCRSLLWSHCSP